MIVFPKQAKSAKSEKCVDGSSSFPELDRGILNVDLSIHTEHGNSNGELLLPGIGGSPGKIKNPDIFVQISKAF